MILTIIIVAFVERHHKFVSAVLGTNDRIQLHMTSFDQYWMIVDQRDWIGIIYIYRKLSKCFLICSPSYARFKVFLMLAKSRKSSFNENIGEFCSIIIIVAFILWRLRLLGYSSNSGICDKVR